MADEDTNTVQLPGIEQKGAAKPKTVEQILSEITNAENRAKAEAFKADAVKMKAEINTLKTNLKLAEEKLRQRIAVYLAETGDN